MHRSAFISFVFHWLCLFSWICICLSVFYHLTLYVYCNIQGITLKARLSVDRDRTQAAAALHCSCNSCVYIKTDFNKNKRWLCFFFILFPRIPSWSILFGQFHPTKLNSYFVHLYTVQTINFYLLLKVITGINCLFYAMSDRKLHVKILLSHVDVGAEKKRFGKKPRSKINKQIERKIK